jgi:hypothetical protein
MNIRGSVPTWVPRRRIDCDNAREGAAETRSGDVVVPWRRGGSSVVITYPPLNPTRFNNYVQYGR